MNARETTCWTVIEGAARGRTEDCEQFARRYSSVVRSYLAMRWGKTGLTDQVDDAVQDVFVECFKQGGVLDRLDRGEIRSFRRFLYGVVRNIALRFERDRGRAAANDGAADLDAIVSDEASLSKTFDRAWARSMVKDAVAMQLDRARSEGEAAERRVELLHLRFYEGLPIREIARRWHADPTDVHRAYARARREFQRSLMRVVRFHNPDSEEDAEKEFDQILAILS